LEREAAAIEDAMQAVLKNGPVTGDLKPKGTSGTTEQVGKAVCDAIG
jgi:isocitrate/isopropylmalate dehydrogenase